MHESMLEKSLPSSPDAERAILGSVILDNHLMAEVAPCLSPQDFHVRANQFVFRAMLALSERGDGIDPITLGEELKREGVLEQTGGVSFIAELSHGLPAAATLRPYVRTLRDKRLLRQVVRAANRVVGEALEDGAQAAAVLEEAEELFAALARQNADAAPRRPLSLAERAAGQRVRYDQLFRGVSNAVPTGFAELDSQLTGGGLQPKQLVLLAARPSVGKTSLMLDIAANVAARGSRVLAFSLEMGAEQLQDRLVSFAAGVERRKIRAGMTDSDYHKITGALKAVSDLPIWVDDSSRSVSRVRKFAREMAKRPETRPDLILVDYLQLVDAEQRRGSRNDDVGHVSRSLKGLAMELDVPVLALSQLSRECERQKREPELSDLRDSGELEQDADVVLFLFGERPEVDTQFYERALKCAKQREGPLFRAALDFNGELVTFRRRPDPRAAEPAGGWGGHD